MGCKVLLWLLLLAEARTIDVNRGSLRRHLSPLPDFIDYRETADSKKEKKQQKKNKKKKKEQEKEDKKGSKERSDSSNSTSVPTTVPSPAPFPVPSGVPTLATVREPIPSPSRPPVDELPPFYQALLASEGWDHVFNTRKGQIGTSDVVYTRSASLDDFLGEKTMLLDQLITVKYDVPTTAGIRFEHLEAVDLATCAHVRENVRAFFVGSPQSNFLHIECMAVTSEMFPTRLHLNLMIELRFSEGEGVLKGDIYFLIYNALNDRRVSSLLETIQSFDKSNPLAFVTSVHSNLATDHEIGAGGGAKIEGERGVEEEYRRDKATTQHAISWAIIAVSAISVCASLAVIYIRQQERSLKRRLILPNEEPYEDLKAASTRSSSETFSSVVSSSSSSSSPFSFVTSAQSSSGSSSITSRLSRRDPEHEIVFETMTALDKHASDVWEPLSIQEI